MRALGLSLGFIGWTVVYTAFSIWLTIVISRHEHPVACTSATSSGRDAFDSRPSLSTPKPAKSTNR